MLEHKVIFKQTTIITAGLLAVLIGLGLARLRLNISGLLVLLSFVYCLLTIKRLHLVSFFAVVLLGLSIGMWRGGQVIKRLEPYREISQRPVLLEVTAVSDGVYADNSQLGFDGGNVRIIEPFEAELPGRVRVQGFGEQAVYRGDIVQVEGKFYPTRGSRQGTVSYAMLSVAGRNNSWIDSLRLRFVAGMESALPEPLASFSLGLLIGQRTTLPDNVNTQLAAAGLTHIIAVSGYNLTIMVRVVQRYGRKRSKYQKTILSLTLVISFLLVTGFSASIVRAAIVSILSLLAWYYGRSFRPMLLLAIAAVLTAYWNPLYLWSDIGWYLSFLAFYGIIVLVPLVAKRFFPAKKELRPLTMLLLETTLAQVMTAPLILYIFGVTSTVALLSNLLIAPLIPIAMLLSFIAGLAGMFAPVISGFLAWPAVLILTYILDVVNLLSRIPHASISRVLPISYMVCMYGAIIFISIVLWRKLPKNANITGMKSGKKHVRT